MNLRKVKVTMPKAQSGLEIKMRAGLGFNANQLSWPVMAGEFSVKDLEFRHTLEEVDRDEANLEAEVGETAVTNLNNDGIPEQYMIGGKRHYAGGTPLNLPDNSYIFSRDNSMKIKDPEILKQFGITNFPRSGVTPADIAKKYNLNKFKKVLLDAESDKLAIETAELMISNYTLKLGKLAIIQESMKGFPAGIPFISAPYLEAMGVDPNSILPTKQQTEQLVQGEEEQPDEDMPTGKYGVELPAYQGNTGKSQTGQKQTYTWYPNYDPQRGYYWLRKNNITGKIEDSPMLWHGTFTPPGTNITASMAYQDPNLMKQSQQASSQQQSQNTSTRTASANAGLSTIRPKSNFNVVDKVFPPLTYNMDSKTEEYDPRLSDISNKKYNKLVSAINSSPDVKEALANKFREILARKDKNNVLNDKEIAALSGMGDDDIIKAFLQYQKQNWSFWDADAENIKRGNISTFDKQHGVGLDTHLNTGNAIHKQMLKNRGFEKDGIANELDVAGVQTASQALLEVMSMPEFKETFKGFRVRKEGTWNDPGNYVDPATGKVTKTSAIDKRAGDDTDAFLVDYDLGDQPSQETGEDKQQDKLEKPSIDAPVKEDKNAPWWIQDIIKNSGAAMDYMRIKKYLPWQAVPSVDYMEPTFYSPERELANNAEQVAMGAEGLAQFSGPQAYNARFSELSGKAAANAADILGKYNNMNVGVANEAEKFNVETFNRYAEGRASNATALYDKVTAANQQYDNSKNQARQQLRQSYIDAITNRAQAYNYNQIYPDWAFDPMNGGMLYGKPPADINPYDYKPNNYIEDVTNWMTKIPANVDPNDWFDQYNIIKGYNSNQSGSKQHRRTPDYYGQYAPYGQDPYEQYRRRNAYDNTNENSDEE